MRLLILLACSPLLVSATLDFQRVFQGNSRTFINAVTADATGNVYIAGSTYSSNLPVTNASQAHNRGTSVVVSDDGGQSWAPTGHLPEDVGAPLKLPAPSSILLTFGVYAVYRSVDDGQTWAMAYDPRGDRDGAGIIESMDYDPRNPSVVYAAGSGGVLKSEDAGATWTLLTSGLVRGGCCLGGVISVDPFRPGRIYRSFNDEREQGRAFISMDSGATWAPMAVPGAVLQPRVIADPKIADALYLYSYEGVYRSTDAGVHWQRLPLPQTESLSWIIPHPAVTGRLYARTVERLLRSDDAGGTWTALSPPGVNPYYAVTSLGILPAMPDFVVVSGTSEGSRMVGLYSTDAGQSWQPLGTNREFRSFSFDPSRPDRIYAGGPATADAFVAKLTPRGETAFLTYLGGQGLDSATAIAAGEDGSVYVGGASQSLDFLGTGTRHYDGFFPSLFAAKLDPSGSLVYTALVGGKSSEDSVKSLAVDAAGRLYVAGTKGLKHTAFAARLAADGSVVEYSNDLVDVSPNEGSITITAAGETLVANGTTLTRFDAAGVPSFNRQFSVYPLRVVVDAEGNVYGAALASGSPEVTPNAFQKTIRIDCPNDSGAYFTHPEIQRPLYMTDVYVFKLSPDLNTLEFATLLGGSCREEPKDLALAPDGTLWIAGTTYSDTFPTDDLITGPPHPNVFKSFVAHLDGTGSRLLYATYTETGTAILDPFPIAAGPGGSVYTAGNSSLNHRYLDSGPALLWKISTMRAPAAMQVTRVTNAYGQSNHPVAPLDIVEVDVAGLVPAQEADLGFSPAEGAPLELGGVSVTFNGAATQLLAVHPGRVLCITPASLGAGVPATVQVKNGEIISEAFMVNVQERDLAFFPQVRNNDGSLNEPDSPAPPGSTISLFVTGAGWPLDGPLDVWFGPGTQSTAATAAPIPGFVDGIYEIRIAAPASAGTFEAYLFDRSPNAAPYDSFNPPPSISVSVR